MNTYLWVGRDSDGELKKGKLPGPNIEIIIDKLVATGITPIDIKLEVNEKEKDIFARFGKGKLIADDVIIFSKQLYTLSKAGVPIQQALKGMEKSAEKPIVIDMLKEIQEALGEGKELSAAIAKYPVFDKFYISMLKMGEMTGAMSEIFIKLVEHLEFEKNVKKRVKEAMRYPTFVVLAMVIGMVIINIFVIPAFSKVFKGFGAELPLMTKILLGFSAFVNAWWPLVLALCLLVYFSFSYYSKTNDGRKRIDYYKLKLPIIGSIIHKATLSNFARSFALASKSGIPVDEALLVVKDTTENAYIGEKIGGMVDGIRRGENITTLTNASGMFTPIVIQMISIGEETGEIDSLLLEVANTYEAEVDYQIKGLSSAIEPILLTVIGVMVLVLALGVFMPMWDMGQAALHSAK